MASLCCAAPSLPRCSATATATATATSTTSTIGRSLPPLRIRPTGAAGGSGVLSAGQRSANRAAVRFSVRARDGGEGKGKGKEEDEESLTDALLSSLKNDSEYLLKAAAGSVGGATAIKYGSVLFRDVTRPNIVQGLLMVSLPVAVAVLILLKESFLGSRDED